MLKKFLSILIAATLLCSLFVIDASAASLFTEDFSSNDMSILTSLLGPTTETWTREIRDGALHIYNPEEGALSQTLLFDAAIEDEAVMQFDVKMDGYDAATGSYLITNIYKGGERGRYSANLGPTGIYSNSVTYSAVHEIGVWYTYIYHMKPDSMDIYRKTRGTDESFKLIVADIARTSNTSPAQFQPYCAKGMDACLDNIKVFEGTFTENASFEMNGTEVESLSGITSGTLNAKATVFSNKATATVVDGATVMAGTNVVPMLVVYNSNHKMVHSSVLSDTQLKAGENSIEISVDTSSFANKLAGGYIGFYIWDGLDLLQPIMDAIELK